VLSAEGRLSAWILTLLPFGTALVMYAVNPDFISILWTDPAGYFLVQITALLLVIGIVWMRKTIDFRI
jgi:tight adherence protein B